MATEGKRPRNEIILPEVRDKRKWAVVLDKRNYGKTLLHWDGTIEYCGQSKMIKGILDNELRVLNTTLLAHKIDGIKVRNNPDIVGREPEKYYVSTRKANVELWKNEIFVTRFLINQAESFIVESMGEEGRFCNLTEYRLEFSSTNNDGMGSIGARLNLLGIGVVGNSNYPGSPVFVLNTISKTIYILSDKKFLVNEKEIQSLRDSSLHIDLSQVETVQA